MEEKGEERLPKDRLGKLPSAGANRNLKRQIGTREANRNKVNFSFI